MSSIRVLADRFRSGALILSAWCGLSEPALAGLLAREEFEAITLDLQHALARAAAATVGGMEVVKMKPGAWLRTKSMSGADPAM
jgi:2-keto-3-deoxy-L-rhamnonate aldolase RhmA